MFRAWMRVYKQNTINHSFHLILGYQGELGEDILWRNIAQNFKLMEHATFSKFLTVNYLASISILE